MADWYHHLGHPAFPILHSIVSDFSLPFAKSVTQTSLCSDCAINKTHKLPFSLNTITSTRPFEYIYTDL